MSLVKGDRPDTKEQTIETVDLPTRGILERALLKLQCFICERVSNQMSLIEGPEGSVYLCSYCEKELDEEVKEMISRADVTRFQFTDRGREVLREMYCNDGKGH